MKIEIIKSNKGDLSYCSLNKDEQINNTSDFFDVIMNCPTDTIIIDKISIATDFFV